MVDMNRQVPTPSASAWSIDLTRIGGPLFVVLRRDEDDARAAVVRHLVDIGSISNTIEAERTITKAPTESVAVVW